MNDSTSENSSVRLSEVAQILDEKALLALGGHRANSSEISAHDPFYNCFDNSFANHPNFQKRLARS